MSDVSAVGAGEEQIQTTATESSFLGIKYTDKSSYGGYLQKFAATDYWHDFHKTKSGPIIMRLGKSYNVNSGISVRSYQTKVLELRETYTQATLYDMFKSYKTNIMLLDKDAESLKYQSEDAVLDSLLPEDKDTQGKYINKYQQFRQNLIDNSREYKNDKVDLYTNISIGPTEDLKRLYTISAIQAKYPNQSIPIAPSFSKVSGGTTQNFILMIDASFLAMSKILELAENDTTQYNFFIIQSIENEGDPATKINRFEQSENPNVHLYFLKDIGHKTYYTPYDTSSGDTSNLFCGCSISAYRDANGLITADIKSNSIETTVDNIGTASEPEEAGFLAFQKLLIKGVSETEEAMVYYLLKRAGDWCQALCLLDRGRSYTIYPYGSNESIARGSLEQLMAGKLVSEVKAPFEIALLTHDKILLSYALTLGLNVFYTIKTVTPGTGTSSAIGAGAGTTVGSDTDESSTSVTWLTYFKNTLDSNPQAILNAANDKVNTIENDIKKIALILKKSNEDISTINFNEIDIEELDKTISERYNEIPSKVIEKINGAKSFENNIYKKGMLTDFLLTTRVVLDMATKIAKMPSDSIENAYKSIKNMQTQVTVETANIYFSTVSAVETTVHTYLQIVQFIENLESLMGGQIPSQWKEEYAKIQQLEAMLQSDLPIIMANKAYVEPYQYFLMTTLPAIQKDLIAFETIFDLTAAAIGAAAAAAAAVGAGAGSGASVGIGATSPIRDALQLDMSKYTITTRDQPRERRMQAWKDKIQTWYKKYTESLGLPQGQSGGGNEGILYKKWIKTREASHGFSEAMIDEIVSLLIAKYKLPEQEFLLILKQKAKEVYLTNIIQKQIYQSEIYSFIDDVLTKAVELYLDTNYESSESLTALIEGAVDEFTEYYTIYNTTLDIGTTITYNNGLGYTLLDNCILTEEDEQDVLQNLVPTTASGYATSVSSNNSNDMIVLFYRYLLLKLDHYTNKVYSLGQVIDDVDQNGNTPDPYYSEEQKLTLKRINECVSRINSIQPNEIATLPNSLEEESIEEKNLNESTTANISKDSLLTSIAIQKVIVITRFLNTTGTLIDPFQLIKLYFFLSPSIENTEDYFTSLLTLFPENEQYIHSARSPEAASNAETSIAAVVAAEAQTVAAAIAAEAAAIAEAEAAAIAEAEAAGAGAGVISKSILRKQKLSQKIKDAEGKAREEALEKLHTTREKYREQMTRSIAREVARRARRNVTLKEQQRFKRAQKQGQIRMAALPPQAGGKRFTKTRSKPKIQKQTRRSQKKYKHKTRRIHKI